MGIDYRIELASVFFVDDIVAAEPTGPLRSGFRVIQLNY